MALRRFPAHNGRSDGIIYREGAPLGNAPLSGAITVNNTRRVQDYLSASRCPATIVLIAINVIAFFCDAILHASNPFVHLIFVSSAMPSHFWTLFTWPLVGGGHPLWLLFACIWAFWACGSLERSWGTVPFTGFFLATNALMALTTWAGGQWLGVPVAFAGLWLAVAAPTVAWCAINARETVNLWMVFNIPAPFLALFTVVIVWYEVGPPVLGLFALSGCAAAYWYAATGRYAYRGYASVRNPFARSEGSGPRLRLQHFDRDSERSTVGMRRLSPFAWYRARQERRKLEKLWERSMPSDPEDGENRRK
jgi:hypothetical protein